MCDENESLQSQLRSSGGGGAGGGGAGGEELTHLRAQNTALQKSLQGIHVCCVNARVQGVCKKYWGMAPGVCACVCAFLLICL